MVRRTKRLTTASRHRDRLQRGSITSCTEPDPELLPRLSRATFLYPTWPRIWPGKLRGRQKLHLFIRIKLFVKLQIHFTIVQSHLLSWEAVLIRKNLFLTVLIPITRALPQSFASKGKSTKKVAKPFLIRFISLWLISPFSADAKLLLLKISFCSYFVQVLNEVQTKVSLWRKSTLKYAFDCWAFQPHIRLASLCHFKRFFCQDRFVQVNQ